jgi:hypothetical protein
MLGLLHRMHRPTDFPGEVAAPIQKTVAVNLEICGCPGGVASEHRESRRVDPTIQVVSGADFLADPMKF